MSFFVNVKKRPNVDWFLQEMSQYFELVVWTAGEKHYADVILDRLDPYGLISHRLYRNHCTVIGIDNGIFLKDLRLIGRDLDKTVILDNSPQNFGFQQNNGIMINNYE